MAPFLLSYVHPRVSRLNPFRLHSFPHGLNSFGHRHHHRPDRRDTLAVTGGAQQSKCRSKMGVFLPASRAHYDA
jgi:hypothetical protein